jgi:hypothetical protein
MLACVADAAKDVGHTARAKSIVKDIDLGISPSILQLHRGGSDRGQSAQHAFNR